MVSRKISLTLLVGWLFVAIALLLLPAPWEWRGGQILRSIYNRAGSFAQPGTHFFLMFVFAVILMELLASQASAKAVRNTICISLGFAVSMELLQSVLPESFSRACDPLDLLPSLAGAICGSVFGFVIHLYSNKGKT